MDMQEAKKDLESRLQAAIRQFERDTGTSVDKLRRRTDNRGKQTVIPASVEVIVRS